MAGAAAAKGVQYCRVSTARTAPTATSSMREVEEGRKPALLVLPVALADVLPAALVPLRVTFGRRVEGLPWCDDARKLWSPMPMVE